MNKAQILQELRKIKDVAFATVDSEGSTASAHHRCDACR